MTKKKKIIIYVICILLFIISTIVIVLYSQGIRFDFKQKKLTQTGAFYFKVVPSNARIYINDEFAKKTDFYIDSAYIGNLLPNKYNVSVKKDGYFSWEKTLEVKEEGLVTKAENIILIKENPEFNLLSKGIKNFFFLANDTKIILLEEKEDNWELKIHDLRTNTKSYLIGSEDISKEKVDFIDLIISPDFNVALLTISSQKDNTFSYHLIDLNIIPTKAISFKPGKRSIENISFYPKNNNKILFLEETSLSEYSFEKKEETITLLDNIISFTIDGSNIYFLDKDGYVIKTNITYQEKEKINETAFSVKDNDYEIIIINEFIFIKEENNLYLINSDNKSFEKFSEENKSIKISPNRQKAVFSSISEISILFLKEQIGQPFKNYKEKMFLIRFSEPIDNLYWLTSHYIIFNSGNKIKISEIDDRDKINIIDLIEYEKPKIHFNQNNKKLYILTENNFIESEPLI